ncbi:MAG: LysE family translocator [Bacteroidales bacterium]|nr:LysE family translocator [Bacteroidales bacterium]
MNPLIEGAILGMTLAVLLGPALFALIQTSILRGFHSGIYLALGIFLSDITLVFLCFIGALQIISNDHNRLTFGIISGGILIIYGIVTFARPVHFKNGNGNGNDEKIPHWYTYILKGYFLNIANPYVWLFWMTVMVGVSSDYRDDTNAIILFFTGALLMVLFTDILKAYVAKKIKNFLTESNVKVMNKVVGMLLLFFGVVLIVRAVMTHYQLF